MPFTLPPITRRRFLAGTVAVGSSFLVGRNLLGQEEAGPAGQTPVGAAERMVDPHRVATISDPHIGGDKESVNRGVNMFNNLQQVVGEVQALDPKPVQVMINGDCAWVDGQPEDYTTYLELIKPLRESGFPIQMTLGNHDNREQFWKAIEVKPEDPRPVESRQVSTLSMERANWFLLDSLDKTNATPGVLGAAQLEWLGKALDEKSEKPAMVMVHHNADFSPRPSALTDTAALMDVLRPRRHVKALIYGHSHVWKNEERDGIHLVNLPATSYVFSPGGPTGWVDLQLKEDGATFKLLCIDSKRSDHGQTLDLKWRDDEKTSYRPRARVLARQLV